MDDKADERGELNELTKMIMSCVFAYEDEVPQSKKLLKSKKVKGITDALEFLENLFEAEEKEIERRHLRALITTDYEDRVRRFAVSIIKVLNPERNKLKKYDVYRRLLMQKHMSYAFFNVFDNLSFTSAFMSDYLEFQEGMYLGLVYFYTGFYGWFKDNEEAIKLLCKYFPEEPDMEKYKYEIASALYVHISNAGTPSDRGYAFQGIAQIEKYIGNLPMTVVMEVLKRYQADIIINNAVLRHQVSSIIEYSQINEGEKLIYKFRLLDSVILAQSITVYWNEKIKRELTVERFSPVFFGESFITNTIELYRNGEALGYWSNGESGTRTFYLDKRPVAKVALSNDESIEVAIIGESSSEIQEFPFSYTDWLLEYYHSKEAEKKLRKLILGAENKYNQMIFSMLYLDNYRGIENQIIDFNHEFQYEDVHKKLKPREEDLYLIKNFYGNSVYTLSCIVGKNGTGKTSIVDFLRESFFKILRLIEDFGVSCKKGYVKENDYLEYGVLDREARFLIVFYLGERPFFLTNINGVVCDGTEPFQAGVYHSINEFSKVAYFSNMLKNNQEDIFFEGNNNQIDNGKINGEREIGRSLRGFRQVDYSETESFITRQKAIVLAMERKRDSPEKAKGRGGVNRELCYQLTFLKNTDAERLCEYLDINGSKMFKISSRMEGWQEETFSLEDLKEPDKVNQLERKFLFLPDAQLQYFSSGQYAKLAFLAKLYWYLEGYHREIERYRDIVGENEFSSDDALLPEETALIFIDEGETYYHPEWQRRYVKTLLEMVNYVGNSSKIQIVITTNSPFILSDILNKDVTYLTGKKETRFDKTLGQNIHKLLKENFFMDYTIGEYAREIIRKIMLCLKNPGEGEADNSEEQIKEIILQYYGKEKEIYSAIQLLIEQIGEPVYRYELDKLLEESQVMRKHKGMEQLLQKKRKIEEEIERLEKKG